MSFKITAIKAFSDNYIWSISDSKNALIVDPGDAKPVIRFLDSHGLTLKYLLITHHHYDHTDGIEELINRYPNVIVYGPHNPIINGITIRLSEGDSIHLDEFDLSFDVLETPGHTLDHIVYVNSDFILCGDTLFSGGCGRMFEGTAKVFHTSLQKLAKLPAKTKVYCTHEYTLSNLQFALSIEPDNSALSEYHDWVVKQRESDLITLPSNIDRERAINPFLRCHNLNIKRNVFNQNSAHDVSDIETFAKLRQLKDNF